MQNFDDFDIAMYEEDAEGTPTIAPRSGLPCFSFALTMAVYSMASNSSTSVACATMTNLTE